MCWVSCWGTGAARRSAGVPCRRPPAQRAATRVTHATDPTADRLPFGDKGRREPATCRARDEPAHRRRRALGRIQWVQRMLMITLACKSSPRRSPSKAAADDNRLFRVAVGVMAGAPAG